MNNRLQNALVPGTIGQQKIPLAVLQPLAVYRAGVSYCWSLGLAWVPYCKPVDYL